MKANDLQAIRDRVAQGRAQGGNPAHGGEPLALYHAALDDLDALLAEVTPEEESAEEPESKPHASHQAKKK